MVIFNINKNFIFFTIVSLTALLLCNCKKSEIKKPNIVFIAVDDLRPDLGCYGNTFIQTPNIDKFASESLVYENHFVNVPTCGASRYSLLTGNRPTSNKHLANDVSEKLLSNQPEKEIPETFIHQLKRNGYHTVGIGKISHSVDGYVYGYNDQTSSKRELPHSWSELLFDAGKWTTGWNAFFGYANGENRQSLKKQVRPYEMGLVDDDGYVDGLSANLAIKKLQELKNSSKPFFLGLGFFKPHLPFNAPKKYWDMYKQEDIPLSPTPFIPKNVNPKSLHDSHEINYGYLLTDEKPNKNTPVSDEYAKKLIHAYYACISYIDHQIGRVIDQINDLGLEKNTIIVIWGDHGWHLGDQNMWGKHTVFENALKSPLLIKVPGRKSSKRIISPVETVDIYPSLLELCQVPIHHKIDGESIINIDKKSNSEVAYSFFNRGISLRTIRYRLTKYYRKEEPTIELYDHQNDPNEGINIAQDSPNIINELLPLIEKTYKEIYK